MILQFLLATAFIAGGNIITAEHVVKGYTTDYVANSTYDVATIYMDLPYGYDFDCRKLKTGETVTVKGYPYINGQYVYTELTTTVIADGNEVIDGRKSVVLATSLIGGFSGSPVFDRDGDVVAVVTNSIDSVDRSLATSVCNL